MNFPREPHYDSADAPPSDIWKMVDHGLDRFNLEQAPSLKDVRQLTVFARIEDRAVGAAIGRTWGKCCELQQLWVEPDFRGQGIAKKLMHQFHEAAIQRGCQTFTLETFSFQAPEFYAKLGYQTQLTIDGYGDDAKKHTMVYTVSKPDSE